MALARCDCAEGFAALACDFAAGDGDPLSPDFLRERLRPDPLGLSLFDPAPIGGPAWPGRDWLPIQVVEPAGAGLAVDWAHFAGAPLAAPFFGQAARRAALLPFNRLFRYRTGLRDFVAGARLDESLAPDGFIFHLSRCGSTLVSQMLAAIPGLVAVAEAAPLDVLVRAAAGAEKPERWSAAIRAMVAALGRRRGGESRYVLKLDFWQAMALPLFRRAFPDVPWIFLYRDPVEVLVSQMDEPGPETDPALMPPSLYGIDAGPDAPREDYCARLLGRVCGAAAEGMAKGGGLAVDHRDLPGAIAPILAHFGIRAGAADRAAMAEIARCDAKAPMRAFPGDAARKRERASAALRAAAETHAGEAWRRLEALSWARKE